MAGLLAISMNALFAVPSADEYIDKYISPEVRDYLLTGDFTDQYNLGLKAMYMAKTEAYYDMGWYNYLKSYAVETPHSNTIKNINVVEKQMIERLAILQNNTWEAWGWSVTKYSAVILATYALTIYSILQVTI